MNGSYRKKSLEVIGRVSFVDAGSPCEIEGVISNQGKLPLRISRGLFRHNEMVNIECVESEGLEIDHSGLLSLGAEGSSAERGSLTVRSKNVALRGDITVTDGQRRQSDFTLHLGDVENETPEVTELSTLCIQLVGEADTRGYILRIPSNDPTDWRIQLGDMQSEEQELPSHPHEPGMLASYQPARGPNQVRTVTIGRVYSCARPHSTIRH